MATINKDVRKLLEGFNKINPTASFLNKASMSVVNEYISTDSLAFNAIFSGKLQDGGIPAGRVTVLAGESMTGKSFFLMRIAKNAIEKGYVPIIVDSENAWQPDDVKRAGLNLEDVFYMQSYTLEDCRNQLHQMFEQVKEMRAEKGDKTKYIIIVDSLSQLDSTMSINRMGKDNTSMDMGTAARAVKTLMKSLTRISAETGTTVVISAHVYDDPGAMFPTLEKAIPGGKSVRYLPSLVIQLARRAIKEGAEKDTDGKLAAGQRLSGVVLRALTVKNRFVKQYLEATSYLSFENGLNPYFGLHELAEQMGVIEADGRSFVLKSSGEKLGPYGAWFKKKEVWDKILPDLQEKISKEWIYGGKVVRDEEEIKKEEEALAEIE